MLNVLTLKVGSAFKTHMVKLHGKNALDHVWGLFTFQTGDEPTIVNLMGQLEMRGANAAP